MDRKEELVNWLPVEQLWPLLIAVSCQHIGQERLKVIGLLMDIVCLMSEGADEKWKEGQAETVCSETTLAATVFPRSDAAATINFPLLALAATIRGRRLIEGGHYNIQGLAGGGYYSRAATIRGRRLIEEIRYTPPSSMSLVRGWAGRQALLLLGEEGLKSSPPPPYSQRDFHTF